MTVRIKIVVVAAVLTGALLGTASKADGAPRGRRAPQMRASRQVRADNPRLSPGAATATRPAWSQQMANPRYTGAFHARYFDELPGMFDRMPMRGTAW